RDAGLVRRVHVGALLEQKRDAFRARVKRSQDERRVALRVAGIHVRAVVEQLTDGLRIRSSDRRDQLGRNRRCRAPVAGANRSRRERLELGKTREQKNRDSDVREAFSVAFPTMHGATPLQRWEKSAGATYPETAQGRSQGNSPLPVKT